MTTNPILENLQNKVVQELPIKSIYADNDFAIFDKGASEFYGSEDEFITDQPLEGVKWNKDLERKDFKKNFQRTWEGPILTSFPKLIWTKELRKRENISGTYLQDSNMELCSC